MAPRRLLLRSIALLLVTCCSAAARRCVAVTEIMKNPFGNESACPGGDCHEFVEFVNCGCDSIPLDSLFITDGRGGRADSIIQWNTPLAGHEHCLFAASALAPGRIAVILDPDYASAPARSRFTIADSALLLTVDAADIVSGVSLSDGLLLYRGEPTSVAESLAAVVNSGAPASAREPIVHTTPAGTPEGYSLIPRHPLTAGEWLASPDSLSPGAIAHYDDQLFFDYRLSPAANDRAWLECDIFSPLRAEPVRWRLEWGSPGTGIASGEIARACPGRIETAVPADTVTYEMVLTNGDRQWRRSIDFSTVALPARSLVVWELFPRATARVPEWIELKNISSLRISIKHWRFGDPAAPDTITTGDKAIEPGGYVLLTQNADKLRAAFGLTEEVLEPEHWPTLNNTSDTVRLWNPVNPDPVEQVCYSSEWFEDWEHQSLDRIDSVNSCAPAVFALAGKPSPGFCNHSDHRRDSDSPRLAIGPVPFTPNRDGRDDFLAISLSMRSGTHAQVTVYGFEGKKLLEFAWNENRPFLWNGATESGDPAPVGPFFVVAEFDSQGDRTIIRAKGVLWR